ncbi:MULTISPECIES: hypothetical protein [Brevibacillus]|uniref:hypothetical protein n=1 Tax=Brevibacillus TaxID=55080 RepID=UPI001EE58AD0|nr:MULTISPECIES: hypothetical protein [Brevibacillus]MCG5254780.1 hypothetical protein [Brevibacillus agri]WNF05491.1 hypothetical protein RFB14_24710 [Brevibacillus borstelensis]
MINLAILFDKFFSTYPIYQRFQPVKSFQELHDWLWKPESVVQMLDAIKFNRPAIEGVVLDIESIFGTRNDMTFTDDFTKKATGMLIKYILEHFGFISSKQKDISKGKGAKWFTSGMHYEFHPERERFRLVTKPIIIDVTKETD